MDGVVGIGAEFQEELGGWDETEFGCAMKGCEAAFITGIGWRASLEKGAHAVRVACLRGPVEWQSTVLGCGVVSGAAGEE